MAKLDPVHVRYIIRQKDEGKSTADIALEMKVSGRRIQQIYKEYLQTGNIPVLKGPGRPRRTVTRQTAQDVLRWFNACGCCAVYLERVMDCAGTHVPHNTIHHVLKSMGLSSKGTGRPRRPKWVRYERTYSNSMWHTDYKQLDDGRWLVAYMDDASRFIVAYGVYDNATGRNALEVLHRAMGYFGRPASILTDRGTQFYANESECRARGATEFERELVRLEIRHILARVNHPQTNGKLERFHGELQRKLPHFGTVDRTVHWWNYLKPHRSLDWDTAETPARAFERKMPDRGTVVTDEQSGEMYDVR